MLLRGILSPSNQGSSLEEHVILNIVPDSTQIGQEVIARREQSLSLSELHLRQQVVLSVGLLHLLALVPPHRTGAEGTRDGGLDLSLLLGLLLELLGLERGDQLAHNIVVALSLGSRDRRGVLSEGRGRVAARVILVVPAHADELLHEIDL